MFTNETFVAILREIPGFLDIVVRYFYELAMHTLGILGKPMCSIGPACIAENFLSPTATRNIANAQ